MLPPANEDLLRRRWIWQALSDLFLDDDITEGTLCGIARLGAECGYSEGDLEAIYRHEVAPAVAFNAFDVAGTWGYFDTVWLEERILRPRGAGYWFHRLVVAPLPVAMLRREWRRVKGMLAEQRERLREERRQRGSAWKPRCAAEAPRYRWESAEPGTAPDGGGT